MYDLPIHASFKNTKEKEEMKDIEVLILKNQKEIMQALIDIIFSNKGQCRQIDQLYDRINETDCSLENALDKEADREGD